MENVSVTRARQPDVFVDAEPGAEVMVAVRYDSALGTEHAKIRLFNLQKVCVPLYVSLAEAVLSALDVHFLIKSTSSESGREYGS